MSTSPILLRPASDLAEAMMRAAEAAGLSRQAWMLAVLEQHAAAYLTAATPDDVPLFTTEGDIPCESPSSSA